MDFQVAESIMQQLEPLQGTPMVIPGWNGMVCKAIKFKILLKFQKKFYQVLTCNHFGKYWLRLYFGPILWLPGVGELKDMC